MKPHISRCHFIYWVGPIENEWLWSCWVPNEGKFKTAIGKGHSPYSAYLDWHKRYFNLGGHYREDTCT